MKSDWDSSKEDLSDSDEKLGAVKDNSDPPLYLGSPLTTSASIVLIMSLVQKHRLTGEAFADLLTVIEAHCPKPNNCKVTVKKLTDALGQSKGELVHHFYCGYCKAYVGRSDDDKLTDKLASCQLCGKCLDDYQGKFVEAPIVSQLQKFFNGKFLLVFM